MSGLPSAVKWTGKWLLQIPIYLVTSYVMRTLIGSCYNLLIKGGANLPPKLLQQHFLWIGLVGGFLAGLMGVFAFRATLLLPLDVAPVSAPTWRRPQAWTWALPTLWLAFGMLAWSGDHTRHTVFSASSATTGSGIAAIFFGSGCSIPPTASNYWNCISQFSFTHPWLGTLGYSAAAFVPGNWFRRLRRPLSSPEEPPENDHSERIAQ